MTTSDDALGNCPGRIDAHVHFYDPSRSEGLEWPSEESVLFRRALPSDLVAEAEDPQLKGVIAIEASQRERDDSWLLELAESTPLIKGVVLNLQLNKPGFLSRLEQVSHRRSFVGVRLRPLESYDLSSPIIRERLRRLGDTGRTLELGARELHDLRAYTWLAEALPHLRCILDHCGHPRIDGSEPSADWLEAIRTFASLPNTYCKATGLLQFAARRDAPLELPYYKPTLNALFEAFGSNRVFYGSNWPPILTRGTCAQNRSLYAEYLADLKNEADGFFRRNPLHIYRLRCALADTQ